MNFEDKVLVRLADPASRAGVFDGVALAQFVQAAYDTDQMTADPPYQPLFDQFRLGVPVSRVSAVEASWGRIDSSERTNGIFQVPAPGPQGTIRVDAFWQGFIVARATLSTGRISKVTTAWPDPSSIDAAIVQALGALPADPAILETERAARLKAAFRAAAEDPNVMTDAALAATLASLGARSVNEYFDGFEREAVAGSVQVTITQGAAPAVVPKALPIAAAVLVRDAAFPLAQLLMDSRLVREQLESSALGRPDDPRVRQRQNLLVVWVVPAAIFDDADWPGVDNAARRTAAGVWLAREGIGLAAVA